MNTSNTQNQTHPLLRDLMPTDYVNLLQNQEDQLIRTLLQQANV